MFWSCVCSPLHLIGQVVSFPPLQFRIQILCYTFCFCTCERKNKPRAWKNMNLTPVTWVLWQSDEQALSWNFYSWTYADFCVTFEGNVQGEGGVQEGNWEIYLSSCSSSVDCHVIIYPSSSINLRPVKGSVWAMKPQDKTILWTWRSTVKNCKMKQWPLRLTEVPKFPKK